MEIYTLKEASRKVKIGMETLKRACEEGLIKATRLANGALLKVLYKKLCIRGSTCETSRRSQEKSNRSRKR